MDRIDIHLDVRRTPPSVVLSPQGGLDSATLREGVLRGRAFAARRAAGTASRRAPFSVEGCALDEGARSFLVSMAELHSMSGRAIVRTLSVARTIADMDEAETVGCEHLAEAVSYRVRDGIGGC